MAISNQERFIRAQKISVLGAISNVFLALIKIIFGLIGHSNALFADGLHSVSDILIDILILLASRFGSNHADHEHPYGHGRIETAATLGLSMILILTGGAIIYEAIHHLANQDFVKPAFFVLYIAALSIAMNEIFYFSMLKLSQTLNSKLLEANALHHRSDSASSFVVVLGAIGSLLGYFWLDAIAAIIVGLLIFKMAWKLGWSSVRELIDTGVPEHTLQAIQNIILTTPGVVHLHELRTRSMADRILVDVHVLVDPYLTVSEGHYIAAKVTHELRNRIEHVWDVVVHIDNESDDDFALSEKSPAREELLPQLRKHWQNLPGYSELYRINFHYNAGKIALELLFHLKHPLSPEQLASYQQSYFSAVNSYKEVKSVELFFSS